MTIFELLCDDHHTLKLKLENLIEVTSPSLRTERPNASNDEGAFELLAELKAAVLAHERAEDAVFYDRLRLLPHRDELADLLVEQHHQIDEHLDDLERMGPGAREWEQTLSLLKNELESHLAEEESAVFPILQLAIEGDESERLARRFQMARTETIEAMHLAPKRKTAPKGAPSRITSR
ncbi:MAG: hemerythrin domain-containing protein [Bdellovibrionota bacterium]